MKIALTAAAMACALAACNVTDGGGGPTTAAPLPPPSGPTFGTQRPDSGTIQRTTVNERTTVSADGNAIRTTRTTTTVGFNPDRAAGAVGRMLAAATPANTGIPDNWTTVSSSNNSRCNVVLYGAPNATSGSGGAACEGSSTLSSINSWRYDNGQLFLMNGGSTVITMNQAGPNQFRGTLSWGFLSTTITMYRGPV